MNDSLSLVLNGNPHTKTFLEKKPSSVIVEVATELEESSAKTEEDVEDLSRSSKEAGFEQDMLV